MLKIKNLRVSVEGKEILKGLDLTVKPGEVHVLMGPNGSGKSTLAYTLAGHPAHCVGNSKLPFDYTQGKQIPRNKQISNNKSQIILDGKNLLEMTADQRARSGIFLAWQNPVDIPGVKVFKLLRESYRHLVEDKISTFEFRNLARKRLNQVGLKEAFLHREINNFSGGERKRWELLQALILRPKYVILDEVDSGLDIEGQKLVGKAVKIWQREKVGIIFITHQIKTLEILKFKKIHVLIDGKIASSGGKEIWEKLQKWGYGGQWV